MSTKIPPRPPKQDSGTLGRFRVLLRGRTLALIGLVGTSIAAGLCEAAFLALATRIAFALTDEQDRTSLPLLEDVTVRSAVGILAVLLVLRLFLALGAAWQSAHLSSNAAAALRENLASSFLRTSWPTQQGEGPGRLQELLTTFAVNGANLIAACTGLLVNMANLAAMVALAAFLDPVGTLVVLGAVLVLGSALRPVRAAIRRRSRRFADSGLAMSSMLAEMSQLGMEIKAFDVQARVADDIKSRVERHRRIGMGVSFLRASTPAIYTGMAYAVLVVALVTLVSIDGVEVETLGTILLVMVRALSYGQAVQNHSAQIASGLPFAEELERSLAHYQDNIPPPGTRHLVDFKRISLEDVSFSYDSRVPALEDVTIRLEAGGIVGLAGPSGGGKSTLVQVLLGLRPPDHGAVLVDGIPISEIRSSDRARLIAFVPQQPMMVTGTIRQNIAFWRDVDDDQIRESAEMAGLLTEIEAHPDGFDRVIGKGGGHLSGGQAQRLCIARALAGGPALLVLDEPTSALDPVSEELIRRTLERIRPNTAILVIAHRRSTLEVCDRIVVMERGRIEAEGTIDSLEETVLMAAMDALEGERS